jgi:hypothetical protein
MSIAARVGLAPARWRSRPFGVPASYAETAGVGSEVAQR